jgi:REP element-mobilizing transposase RayT
MLNSHIGFSAPKGQRQTTPGQRPGDRWFHPGKRSNALLNSQYGCSAPEGATTNQHTATPWGRRVTRQNIGNSIFIDFALTGPNTSGRADAWKLGIRCFSMSQSLVRNLIHLVYSTKQRQPWLSKAHRDLLFAYQAGIFQEWDSPSLVIGGADDHVHALFALSKNHALKKIVEEVKKGSSRWAKGGRPEECRFLLAGRVWRVLRQPIQVDEVKRYIENQEEHHRLITFQDELRAFYRRHGIEFDERYVWD